MALKQVLGHPARRASADACRVGREVHDATLNLDGEAFPRLCLERLAMEATGEAEELVVGHEAQGSGVLSLIQGPGAAIPSEGPRTSPRP